MQADIVGKGRMGGARVAAQVAELFGLARNGVDRHAGPPEIGALFPRVEDGATDEQPRSTILNVHGVDFSPTGHAEFHAIHEQGDVFRRGVRSL